MTSYESGRKGTAGRESREKGPERRLQCRVSEAMRLFLSIAVIACGCGAARGDPGKIIVDGTNKVDDRRWKPYDVRLQREERVHGEVLVLSPPLFVRGPPKGFPFRVRTKRESGRGWDSVGTFRAGTVLEVPVRRNRAASQGRLSGRQNRLPDAHQMGLPRHPSYYQPGRVQGEVVVHSSSLSVKGPPKGPLRRKTRQAPEILQEKTNSTQIRQQPSNTPTFGMPNASRKSSMTSKPAKRTSTSAPSIPAKPLASAIASRTGTKSKPAKGRHSMMKRLKKMWPYMLIPTMMTLGYAPFVLSSLKMFVMNALMLNFMAFNAAIMLTLRNMVFGPRIGGHTKYVNYGYQHGHHGDER